METVKGMCSDARREINQLEATLLEIINQTMTRLIERSDDQEVELFKAKADISENHRKSFENHCFSGLRNIKRCLSSIQNDFEPRPSCRFCSQSSYDVKEIE